MSSNDAGLQKRSAAVNPSRRAFLSRAGLASGVAAVSAPTLAALAAHSARAHEPRPPKAHGHGHDNDWQIQGYRSEYGAVAPVADQDGNYILALPPGFRYVTFSKTGSKMSDGHRVPRAHDGMTCVEGRGHVVRLIRNHEVRTNPGSYNDPSTFSLVGPADTRYDPLGVGGTVTVDFDLKRKQVVREFVSLNGTIVNCSGGLAWRNTGWITSEESVAGPELGWGKKHGYNFLVPANANRTVPAIPLTWMGRMAHEAAVADANGIIYETEDAGNSSGFYRATPHNRANVYQGGKLEMLAIKGAPQANLFRGQTVGKRLPVEWVAIDDPDPDLEGGAASCFAQGRAKGGAAFNRLEGIFTGLDGRSIYFVSTSGGESQYGQLWHYIPADPYNEDDQLVLVFESPSGSVLDSPDNICITPRGGILFCEDDASGDGDGHPLAPGISDVNRLIGMGGLGEPFEFAVNILNDSEFAGACFSPDGRTLFVNIFGGGAAGSGMTCAIWGPWEVGPL
jgi:secreted PhoX family phosphatase